MSEIAAFNGTRVVLTEERWKHILVRHSELENKINKIMEAVMRPDESYIDPTGSIHALKKVIHEASDYIVAIYRKTDEKGYIRTAYYMNLKRKERRYRRFRKLRPSWT